jgi:hypothetical protein
MSFSKLSLARVTKQVAVGLTTGLPGALQVAGYMYGTDDAAATVETAGYFNNARNLVRKGDFLIAVMVHGGTVVIKLFVFDAVPASGNVTIKVASVTAA